MVEIIVDPTIRLKEVELKDVTAIFKTIDNERIYLSEWLPFVSETLDVSYTRTFVRSVTNSKSKELVCVIFYLNKLVGLIAMKDSDFGNRKTEIGYWLSEAFQNKGIITKSCKALIQYAFDTLEINRIQIKVATQNYKSQRVAERLGFVHEGIEREGELHTHGFVDLIVFSLLKSDFEKQ
ncbi:MAG: GNAT family N-acetyltransferase [Paludibacter sp.]|nr:GNAT family N-acetyltransferase [Paludibacter sp.]